MASRTETLETWFRNFRNLLQSLLAAPGCVACESPLDIHENLCAVCEAEWKKLTGDACTCCALPFSGTSLSSHLCSSCLRQPPSFDRVWAPFEYEGSVGRLIGALKFRRRLGALDLLIPRSVEVFQNAIVSLSPDLLVPMPLSWRRCFQRGFNQSALLCHGLKKQSKVYIPELRGVLRRHREPQAQQRRAERLQRLKGSFWLKQPEALAGKKILIVDDVMTTGATVEALAHTLKQAGALRVEAWVLARVRRDS